MKAILVAGFTFLALTVTALGAAPGTRAEKLRSTPLTVYPTFDARGTGLVARFNAFATAEDALVVSYTDAFKGAFRVSQVGVTRGQVWVHVPGEASLGQRYRKNVEGARGVVYVPTDARKTDVRRAAEQVAEEAQALGVPLIVGLDDRDTGSLTNVADIARSGDVITICASSRLKGSVESYRAHVGKVIRAAREANPRIKVELAFVAGSDAGAGPKLIELATASVDLADRIAVYCDNTPESLANLGELVAALRPPSV
ncbi:MAG: hypothetical protein NTV51_13650 [Verrucomicrobia bacterium]|nr:hypothetical protein [Verrucomicrobiota bacterium]